MKGLLLCFGLLGLFCDLALAKSLCECSFCEVEVGSFLTDSCDDCNLAACQRHFGETAGFTTWTCSDLGFFFSKFVITLMICLVFVLTLCALFYSCCPQIHWLFHEAGSQYAIVHPELKREVLKTKHRVRSKTVMRGSPDINAAKDSTHSTYEVMSEVDDKGMGDENKPLI